MIGRSCGTYANCDSSMNHYGLYTCRINCTRLPHLQLLLAAAAVMSVRRRRRAAINAGADGDSSVSVLLLEATDEAAIMAAAHSQKSLF